MGIRKNKKGFEMSFSMIFSLIAGAVILFLAIYATMRFIDVGKESTYAEAAKSIDNYLGNLVTGIAEGVSTKISFRKETRVMFSCYLPDNANNPFGKQTIGFSEESGIRETWYNSTTKITRKNKYIFANNTEQGKKIFIFIKPFYMGFKVDDLIIMSSSTYCFVRGGTPDPSRIIEDLENLQMENVKVVDNINECGKGNITVCFGDGCDINVYSDSYSSQGYDEYETGYVQKGSDLFNYAGNLLYGAIFSSKNIYDCNLARLGEKTATLSELYLGKISQVESKGCDSRIETELYSLSQGFGETTIVDQYQTAKGMDEYNSLANCKIYPGETYGNI